ncbi:unnamed protein product [Rotaria sp. Silwood2]|nr:unnamed protein product [Rotaria sp. Silwood2]CAF3401087.1 unnamed protein product [Rotaria sp. Silwood2]CAF3496144.1 unnamed protein product [Rotaria sp. Silwood2]CAF4578211.1 unnamed protein product [Rotaria sp. Silwood2]CAF4597809.1 unnamed protein product [Rotaria sp. Silwood2]
MVSPSNGSRRILSEINRLTNDPEVKSYFHYESSGYENNDPSNRFVIYGYILPRTFPYKYGSFKVKIRLPDAFPFEMPEVVFVTQIYHLQTTHCGAELWGHCCVRCENWRPTTTVSELIKTVVDRIDQTDAAAVSNPRNFEAHSHYMRDNDDYWKTVMNMIEKHAYRRTDEPVMSLKFMAKRILRRQIEFDSEKMNRLPLPGVLRQYLQIPFDQN